MSGEQKLKEGDQVAPGAGGPERGRAAVLLGQVPGVQAPRPGEFEDTKASVLGDYIPAQVQMEEGESAVYLVAARDFSGFVLFVFENGKAAKVELCRLPDQARTGRSS